MTQPATCFPLIDYADHPAFRSFSPALASKDAIIEEAIRRADAVLEEMHASASPLAAAELKRAYESRVLPAIDSIGHDLAAALPAELAIAGIAEAALAETRRELLAEALFQNASESDFRRRRRVGGGRTRCPGPRR